MTVKEDEAAETVTIIDLDAHVLRDTANARIRFYLCVVDPASVNELFATTHQNRPPEECSNLSPDVETTIKLNTNPGQQVVMSVELLKPGVVEIQGMDMTYRSGWQTGTQRIGSHVLLRSR